MVFDFDDQTDEEGPYSIVSMEVAARRNLSLVTPDDPIQTFAPDSCLWIAAGGLSRRPSTRPSGGWREWSRGKLRNVRSILDVVAQATEPRPTTAIVFGGDPPYVESLVQALDESFRERLAVVVAAEEGGRLAERLADLTPARIELSFGQFATAVREAGMEPIPDRGAVRLPRLDGGTEMVPATDMPWLGSELELVHAGAEVGGQAGEEDARDFLRGLSLTWYAVAMQAPVQRDITSRLVQDVRSALGSRNAQRINLFHRPGAGGSTVGRVVLWELHNEFPCVLVKRQISGDTIDRLRYLFDLTSMPVLVLLESASSAPDMRERLFDSARVLNLPITLLQIERRNNRGSGERASFLDALLTNSETFRFIEKYKPYAPKDRLSSLQKILNERDTKPRNPFFIALTTFGRDFASLESYVARATRDLSPGQRACLLFAAMSYHFGQASIPMQILGSILGLPSRRLVRYEDVVSPDLTDLLVEEPRGSIRPIHELVAEELVVNLLGMRAGAREAWRNAVADAAIELAGHCADLQPLPGGGVGDFVRQVFTARETSDTPAGDESPRFGFSPLVGAVNSPEGQERVLTAITELFPEEPQFWAHLGRYLSYERADFGRARRALDEALRLAPDDSVIVNMSAMSIRSEVYDRLDQIARQHGSPAPSSDAIRSLTDSAAATFARAREIDPRDEHNYVAEIQMNIRVINRCAVLSSSEGIPRFLSLPGNGWFRLLFDRACELADRMDDIRGGGARSGFHR
jgi:hypothetical protein